MHDRVMSTYRVYFVTTQARCSGFLVCNAGVCVCGGGAQGWGAHLELDTWRRTGVPAPIADNGDNDDPTCSYDHSSINNYTPVLVCPVLCSLELC